jgi:hypothetical protein
MPIALVAEKDLPKSSKASKITKTSEWIDLLPHLTKGIPAHQVVRITFSDATKKHFKNSEKKAAVAFAIKLRNEWGQKYKIQVIGGIEVRVSNLKN